MKTPIIKAKIVFLSEKDGGLKQMPTIKKERYLPHLVVQESSTREAQIVDEYLGVHIVNGPESFKPDEENEFELSLINFPVVKYEQLKEGVTFTVRDGPHVVGFGKVIFASPRQVAAMIAPWNEKKAEPTGSRIIQSLIRVSIIIFLVEGWFIFSHGKSGHEMFLAFIVLICVIYYFFK